MHACKVSNLVSYLTPSSSKQCICHKVSRFAIEFVYYTPSVSMWTKSHRVIPVHSGHVTAACERPLVVRCIQKVQQSMKYVVTICGGSFS